MRTSHLTKLSQTSQKSPSPFTQVRCFPNRQLDEDWFRIVCIQRLELPEFCHWRNERSSAGFAKGDHHQCLPCHGLLYAGKHRLLHHPQCVWSVGLRSSCCGEFSSSKYFVTFCSRLLLDACMGPLHFWYLLLWHSPLSEEWTGFCSPHQGNNILAKKFHPIKAPSVRSLTFWGISYPGSFTLELARVRCLRSSPWFRSVK